MKRIMFSTFVLLITFFVAREAASAQAFLLAPKGEKKWMEYFYRANGAAPGAKPSVLMSGGIGFTFPDTPDTSGFSTKHPAYNGSLLGNLENKTVSANISVTSFGAFTYYGQGSPGNPCGTPATVRLYFQTQKNDLGESQYWWSYSAGSSYVLAPGSATLSANLNPANWSDRDGHPATFDASHMAAFSAAAADVELIGMSFGGGCFYANGVGEPSGTATFTLTNFTVN